MNTIVKYSQLKKDVLNRLQPCAWGRSKQSRRGLAEQKHGKPCARQTKQQQKRRGEQAGVWAISSPRRAIVLLPSLMTVHNNESPNTREDD